MAAEVETLDVVTADDRVLQEVHQLCLVEDEELVPGDPPEPFAQRLADWRHMPAHHDKRKWIVREDGEVVGLGELYMNKKDDLNNGVAWFFVRPDRRGRGHATRLAEPILRTLIDNGRGSLIIDAPDGSAGEVKLERLGMTKAFQERISRLKIDEIDWELMDRWIERAAERAGGYELLNLSSPIPDEHLERWSNLRLVMNTAPKEGLAFEDFSMTAEKWRDIERQDLEAGRQVEACVAVHKESGEFVGLSEIVVLENRPDLAWQGDTGVDPGHRDKGLGRWLKAAMIQRLVGDHPEVTRIDTGNAGSNEPMLNINVGMGYRPLLLVNAWQGEVATIVKRLQLDS